MKISVIIVSYNAISYLEKCISSVIENRITDMEIIVWDNNSTDRSVLNLANKYPEVIFRFHDENLGFSKANNRAVSIAKGEYVLILNPDTEVEAKFFETILNFAEIHDNLGALGVRMINEKGNFLPESKRNVPHVLNSFSKLFKLNLKNAKPYYAEHIKENESAEVEILSGACMLMKKEVYQRVNGFDERYFMYGEDIDLSYTLLRNGYVNYYLGSVTLLHHKGESTVKNKLYLQRFYGAMALFLEKYEKQNNVFLYYVALLGVKTKYYIELLKLSFHKSALA